MHTFTILVYALWLASEILINRLTRSKAQDAGGKDKASLGIIWLTILLSIALSVYIASRYYFPVSTSFPVAYTGLGLVLAGVALRLIIIKTLGRFFTADVTIRQDHALKKDGFYKFLRHPSYSASLLSFIGFGLSLNNWISLIVVTVAILGAFIYRIRVEEKALIGYFGEAYIEYRRSTKALIPFVY